MNGESLGFYTLGFEDGVNLGLHHQSSLYRYSLFYRIGMLIGKLTSVPEKEGSNKKIYLQFLEDFLSSVSLTVNSTNSTFKLDPAYLPRSISITISGFYGQRRVKNIMFLLGYELISLDHQFLQAVRIR